MTDPLPDVLEGSGNPDTGEGGSVAEHAAPTAPPPPPNPPSNDDVD